MGWTSEVQFHVGAPKPCADLVRKRFTHKGFQNFTAGYRGLIGMDAPSEHAEAHSKFGAYALDVVDQSRSEELTQLLGQAQTESGFDPLVNTRIVELASDSRGQLVYEFSIWKDNVTDVATRLVQVLAEALRKEFGKQWKQHEWGPDVLFVHLRTSMGGLFEEEATRIDLTPTLLSGHVEFDDVMEAAEDCDNPPPRLGVFEEFTAELQDAHLECEPDAFNCYDGGCGAKVEVHGLQARPELNGQTGVIMGPVDLETRRWPVKLGDSQTIAARRRNLKLAR